MGLARCCDREFREAIGRAMSRPISELRSDESVTRLRDTDRDSVVQVPANRDSSEALGGESPMGAHRWISLGGALLLGILGAEAVLGAPREQSVPLLRLESQVELLSDETERVFHDSRLLTPMLRHLHNMDDAIAELRFLVRTDATAPPIRAQLFRIEADAQALVSLMKVAEGRSRRGTDPPTCGCAVSLRRRVEAFQDWVIDLREDLDDRRGGRAVGWSGHDRCPSEPRQHGFDDDFDSGFEPWDDASREEPGFVIRGRNFSIGLGSGGGAGAHGPTLRLW